MNLHRPGSIPTRIMERAEALPEATPICPNALLDLGNRAAVDQALSRLVREGRLDRIFPGIHMRPIETRFGLRSPDLAKSLHALAEHWGEVIVPHGGASANILGLTTQNQVVPTCLTSGPDRTLRFGARRVVLIHAPRWQLTLPHRPAGEVIRALYWLGRERVRENLRQVLATLSARDRTDLQEARPVLPIWMAEAFTAELASG